MKFTATSSFPVNSNGALGIIVFNYGNTLFAGTTGTSLAGVVKWVGVASGGRRVARPES